MLIKQSILSNIEIEELKNICITICKKYKVPLIESLVIDGRLRSSNGIYSVYNDLTESKIQLSKKVYLKFGMDQIRKTLKHELAHHICKFKYDDLSHGEKFLNICNEVGGSISYDVATKEYEHLVTESFITPKYH